MKKKRARGCPVSSGGEAVLENPLGERLRPDRPSVVDAVFGDGLDDSRCGGGDPVDHRAGEGDVGLDPGGEVWVETAREGGDGGLGDKARVASLML